MEAKAKAEAEKRAAEIAEAARKAEETAKQMLADQRKKRALDVASVRETKYKEMEE